MANQVFESYEHAFVERTISSIDNVSKVDDAEFYLGCVLGGSVVYEEERGRVKSEHSLLRPPREDLLDVFQEGLGDVYANALSIGEELLDDDWHLLNRDCLSPRLSLLE